MESNQLKVGDRIVYNNSLDGLGTVKEIIEGIYALDGVIIQLDKEPKGVTIHIPSDMVVQSITKVEQ